IAILRSIQERHDARGRPVPRNVHSKQHGCVWAELTIEQGVPEGLRHGLFREARMFAGVVRFSNSKQRHDELPDAHGMAIKLIGVEGAKLREADRDAGTQDFVLVDHPVFFAKHAADMIPLAEDFRRLMCGGPIGKVRTLAKAALSRDYRFRLLRTMAAKRPGSPLGIQYWSTTPFRLGATAAKVSLRPTHDGGPAAAGRGHADKLRRAMSAHLAEKDAWFDFLVQPQTNALTMPIEDPTVVWDQREAPWVKVATLRIPRQRFETPEQLSFGERLSFTPWRGLAAHRPLGGINRARRRIYEAMAEGRHRLNGEAKGEPTWDEVRALWRDA
ncbi:MAG TPA: catalase family protein, partial [Opitutus sp.]|nr:catalase family protein [Opitutus sp.]